tara:strand:- start:378 stop:1331 length:954 start_codon:yes stop_codon:yes gene_type:complete
MYKFHINFSVNINMSSKKSISINPSYFKIGGSKKKKKEKPKMKNTLKPNDIKKKLIAKIKAHQKKEKDREITEKEKEENTFKNEFQETLSYLETMKKKKAKAKEKKRQRKEKKRNKTMKNTQKTVDIKPDIQIDLQPMNSIAPAPPYGCLKGGNKPTYRQYNKTLKRNKEDIQNEYKIRPPLFNLNTQFEERSDKLEKLKDKFKEINQPTKPKKTKIKTRRIRRKITLGKNRKGGFIGVLVKSKKTRKNVKKEVDVLKRKSIQEVKEYLRKHNLTKIGSNAPDHILRTTYESAYLSGDVSNSNPDILLHNWHKDEDI